MTHHRNHSETDLSPRFAITLFISTIAANNPIQIKTQPNLPLFSVSLAWPNLHLTVAGFQLQVDGQAGIVPVVIYASTNLADWTPIYTNPPMVGSLPFLDSSATGFARRFYRAKE